MSEQACESCGKPADMEITPHFVPLTARGERACERIKKSGDQTVVSCLSCLMKAGAAVERGDFAEENE